MSVQAENKTLQTELYMALAEVEHWKQTAKLAVSDVKRLTWMVKDCAASMYDDRYIDVGDDGSMDLDGFTEAIFADLVRRYAEREEHDR